ncbi:MAG: hypothetical protein C0591_13090, partial [Marinilabiliales bacterium]
MSYMIIAPTLFEPGLSNPENIYRAMRAILRLSHEADKIIKEVYLPGLGKGIGHINPYIAARNIFSVKHFSLYFIVFFHFYIFK